MSDITSRLNILAQNRYGKARGWKTKFAKDLGVSLQYVSAYLSGNSYPGRVFQERMRKAGFTQEEIEYLNTGKRREMMVREQQQQYYRTSQLVRDLEAELEKLKKENELLKSLLSPKALRLIKYEKKEMRNDT